MLLCLNGVITEDKGMYIGMVVIMVSSLILVGITFWNVLRGIGERIIATEDSLEQLAHLC